MRKFLKNSEATLLNCPLGKSYNSIIDVNKDIFAFYIIIEYITSSSEVIYISACIYIFKPLKIVGSFSVGLSCDEISFKRLHVYHLILG